MKRKQIDTVIWITSILGGGTSLLSPSRVIGAPGCLDPPGDLSNTGTAITNVTDVQCAVLTSLWQLADGKAPNGSPNPQPTCLTVSLEDADLNCDVSINIADVQLVIHYALDGTISAVIDENQDNCPDDCQIDSDMDGEIDKFDCAPTNPLIFRFAIEICNGLDDDCDGKVDNGSAMMCDDGDACTIETCDGNSKACIFEVVVCDDDIPCTDDICDADSGCLHVPDHNNCDDNDPSTINTCDPISGCVSSVTDCDDGNPCTTDTWDDVGECIHAPMTDGACPITGGKGCPSNPPCETCVCAVDSYAYSCNVKWDSISIKIAHGPVCAAVCAPVTTCDDGNICTSPDICIAGQCGGFSPDDGSFTCDDNIPCTLDTCDDNKGCLHIPQNAACDDGNACTQDICDPVVGCISDVPISPVCNVETSELGCSAFPDCEACVCDFDSWCCTTAWDAICAKETQDLKCVEVCNVSPDYACDDGNACTKIDTCSKGQCSGQPITCYDGNQCTIDTCDPESGCVYINEISPPCSVPKVEPGCSAFPDCEACVCALDSFCCASGWDSFCVFKSEEFCSLDCPSKSGVCEDGIPCTWDVCDPKVGCLHTPKNWSCLDGIDCTLDTCDPQKGCIHAPQNTWCDDNNVCTEDYCEEAVGCVYDEWLGMPCLWPKDEPGCDVWPPCEACVCNLAPWCCDVAWDNSCVAISQYPECIEMGVCTSYQAKTCNDDNLCTQNDACILGQCTGTVKIDCDDNIPCTLDWCSPVSGCKHEPNDLACDDNNDCTDDICNQTSGCVSKPPTVPLCNAVKAEPGCNTAQACEDCVCGLDLFCCEIAWDALCVDKTQHPACVGVCNADLIFACDDGNACTKYDSCEQGQCFGLPFDCDDDNACTNDICVPSGECIHFEPTDPPCAVAKFEPGCSDFPACETCVCNLDPFCCSTKWDALCVSESKNNWECGNICSPADPCDDGIPCTLDTCDPQEGCIHAPQNTLCDDNNVCTEDICEQASGCVSELPTVPLCDEAQMKPGCDMSPPCEECVCDLDFYCCAVAWDSHCVDKTQYSACVGACNPYLVYACDDGNACTKYDVCYKGQCGGDPFDCDDSNPCTIDTCDPASGCVHTNKNETPCSDGNACTSGDTCVLGLCDGIPITCYDGNPCTTDMCDPGLGCVYANKTGTACNDGNACTSGDTCGLGVCNGMPIACYDGNPCTTDGCSSQLGCVYSPATGSACNDGNACTYNDQCTNGLCGGTPVVCDDNNPCTNNSCSPGVGCSFYPNSQPCNDGSVCTTNDQCSNGQCSGSPISCSDGNPCTGDWCHQTLGCIYTQESGASCNDNNACTSGDACASGTCTGISITCYDGNPCTSDSCNTGLGCVYKLLTGPACNDGQVCTTQDTCNNGTCTGTAVVCNDNNPCTNDSCSPFLGCIFASNSNCPCSGKCGGQSSAGCWCDSECEAYGDCCWDACQSCGTNCN